MSNEDSLEYLCRDGPAPAHRGGGFVGDSLRSSISVCTDENLVELK